MIASDGTRRLATWLSLLTLVFLLVYVPAETYVTLFIAGLPGLAPLFTALTVCVLIASMVLVFRTAPKAATSSR